MSRLSPERLEELYRGTLGLVVEHGFERITMDQIAETTRSSKATLYRQWGSKTALVVEAITCLAEVPAELPDTGSLRGDLFSMIEGRSRAIEAEADLIGAILHAVKSDAELHTALREQIISAFRVRLDSVVRRAVDRGEIHADNPALAFVDLVVMAPFVLRLVIDDEPVDDTYLTTYLDAVLLPAVGVTD